MNDDQAPVAGAPVLGEPPVLTAALILAGYRPWWLPPVTTPDAIRRGMLGGST